jgi:hypothetical protein
VYRSTRGRIEWREIVAQATTFDVDSTAEMNVYATVADAVYRRDALSARAKVAVVLAAEDLAGRAMAGAALGAQAAPFAEPDLRHGRARGQMHAGR